MNKDNGITLMMVILTVIIMLILVGILVSGMENTYENSKVMKFTSYLKIIQKKIDLYVEDGTNIETLGENLDAGNKAKLQDILNKDSNNLIETRNVNNGKIRYFDSSDIYEYFDIADINDEIVVNFENREVISLNGVEKDGRMYYVEKGL